MGAFHVVVVPELQYRMIAAVGGHDELVQVRTPAKLRALGHGVAQPRLVSEIPGERARDPAADVIKGRGGLREIKHGLLDLGPRRVGVSLRSLIGACGAVKAYPVDRLDPTLNGNSDVNHLGGLVGKPM
jgi:hypothetical protein